ncbi:General stress protein 69 [Caloramator mitchellensis]|uniref:General stress protein 69 n=1 Tax=Caloramator mitchellensis TaxID=908809 RepID=A0A0R3JTM5_CALMK|nr:aldo/keto reductase [Caloramator mitchellensis]KRQ86873.1 General stress protein 69 [Caloramator mitchellensis]
MEYIRLGDSNLLVSKLCFGSLTIGPLQSNLPLEEGANVILEAFNNGVNIIDTAKLYKTYPYIKRALELYEGRNNIIISSKSYDWTYDGMKESIKEALRELNVDSIGIFMMHEQESRLTLKGHQEALRCLVDAKKAGLIKAVGVSTHAVEVVEAISQMGEVDVIHPIFNKRGLGIIDGNIEDMKNAIELAFKSGKGILAMKPLGGGNLIKNVDEAFEFVLNYPYLHSIAVGMQSVEEVHANISRFEGKKIDEEIINRLKNKRRKLHVEEWCEGCGDCVNNCPNDALFIEDDIVKVKREKCLLCGYCSAYCKNFCLKII